MCELLLSKSGGRINQVRPIKYLVLVIYAPARERKWIVIPPDVIVQKAIERKSGQHCKNPLECMQLALGDWAEEYSCGDGELEESVKKAIERGKEQENLRKLLKRLDNDTKRHVEMQKLITKAVLSGEELDL